MGGLIKYHCDNCGKLDLKKPSIYKLWKHHFCSRKCYTEHQTKMKPEEHNHWKGGISPKEAMARYRKKNREKLRAAAKARRLRELNAPGSHTAEDWEKIKQIYGHKCAVDDDTCRGRITKDHKVPLIMGGSNSPNNLQVLCHGHNIRKARKVHVGQFNPEGEN